MDEILLVEDSPNDIELTLMALEENHLTNKVDVVRDGEQPVDYLYRSGAYEARESGDPRVMLLDLKLPKIDGLTVLERVKSDPALKKIPVVMLTSSREEVDLLKSYDLGANAYVVKPVSFLDFMEAVKELGLFWAVVNQPPPGPEHTA